MRIAIVYDCLYPHTIGGAERWYRSLSERLAERHQVTYLTQLQWSLQAGPGTPFPALALAPRAGLYARSGRRKVWPPIRFGLGVFWHLLFHAGRYDVVHSASFPYFSLVGAWLALRIRRRGRLIVDWHEVWSRKYWIDYLGPIGGRVGYAVQRLCISLPDESFTFSRLHERRLREEGHRAQVTRLTGEYADHGLGTRLDADVVEARSTLVVFAGRHIPEKRVVLVPDAIASARRGLPGLRCTIFGDGPEHERVRKRVEALGLTQFVDLPGRVGEEEVRRALASAACLLLPSAREGFGLVVVEALARGTPAIVVQGPDNAATELIEPGVNGYVARAPDPAEIGALLVDAIHAGPKLRRSTFGWYRERARELSIESSLSSVEAAYARLSSEA